MRKTDNYVDESRVFDKQMCRSVLEDAIERMKMLYKFSMLDVRSNTSRRITVWFGFTSA